MKLELWGIDDVAKYLGITATAAYTWRHRGKLPDPEWIVSGRPIWRPATIRKWAKAQDRGAR